jgi:signal transduction histidine kinase/ligand-binding sensor domain-containing protein
MTLVLAVAGGILLAAPRARALDPARGLGDCSVEIWRVQDGLPAAWIRGITQSADGYLWIGTQGGVARYGGGPLEIFIPPRPLEYGEDVMGLSVGRDGAVWVLPARGRPLCLRGESYGGCLADPGPLPASARLGAISQDDDGVTWLAAPDGVFRAEGGSLTLAWPASAWGSQPATAVEHDRQGRLWVGTARGLYAGDATGPLHPVPPAGGVVTALARGRTGAMWVVGDRTVARLEGGQAEVLTAADGLPAARLTTALEDRDGNLWIGSREGLIRWQRGHGFRRFTDADGLPDGDISALFEDREGSLWVGTRSGGLAQFTDRTLDRRVSPPSLVNQWISSVAEDDEGTVWVGTGRGLTGVRDGVERTITRADGLPGDQVLAVHPGPRGELWAGTEGGLARLRAGKVERVAGVSGPVTALLVDGDAVWAANGDALFHLQGDRLDRFALPGSLDGGEVRAIGTDDEGVIWICANGRLLRLGPGGLSPDPTLSLEKVRSISRDADGTLWLGAGEGLVRRRHGRWRIFAEREGLGRNDLYQVIADDLGYLWVGTSRGLLRLPRAALDEVDSGRRARVEPIAFEVADQRREVRVTRTRQPGAWKNRQGLLRFATSRGVLGVDPRHLPTNPLPPPVVIERALVDGRPARRGARNEFPPGSGAFELHFAAITLIEPRKAQHRYRLEGYDADWVLAGTRRSAYYTNMRPGHYRFRVQGANADGVWNSDGDSLELILAPHFYQASWFYALSALLVLGAAAGAYRLRVGRIEGRYLATLAERARVAREVHDSLLQGMTATLMHLRGLRKRFSPGAAPVAVTTVAGEIRTIEALVSTNIEETRQFVWDLREGRPPELATAVTELAERASGGAARVTIEGRPGSVPPPLQHELLQIAQEALANAVRHAGPARLEVRLRFHAGGLTLTVADDGRGFDPRTAPGPAAGHFGLAGMRERAAALGSLAVTSAPGRGTTVTVTLEDGHDD